MLFRERNPWSTFPLPFKKSFSWEKNCILSDSSSCFSLFLIPVSGRREKHSCGNWLIQISHRASVEKTPLMPIRENVFWRYRRSIIYTKYLQCFSFYFRKMSFVVIVKVPLQWACWLNLLQFCSKVTGVCSCSPSCFEQSMAQDWKVGRVPSQGHGCACVSLGSPRSEMRNCTSFLTAAGVVLKEVLSWGTDIACW